MNSWGKHIIDRLIQNWGIVDLIHLQLNLTPLITVNIHWTFIDPWYHIKLMRLQQLYANIRYNFLTVRYYYGEGMYSVTWLGNILISTIVIQAIPAVDVMLCSCLNG